MLEKYYKPQSVTWWAGAGLIAMGIISGIGEGFDIGGITRMVDAWTGNLGAYVLIVQGAGLIGIRGAIGASTSKPSDGA